MSQLIQNDWNWSMHTWYIRRPEEGALNDPIIAEVAEVEYHGEYMGECYLSVTVNSEIPIDFTIDDYIVYRGERFFLSVVPACKQQAKRGSSGDAFVYENMKFNSLANELATCDFLDVVPSDNKMHWTALPTFSFYCEDVKALADRIQANLDRVYGENKWHVEVGNYKPFDEEISIDKQTVWDALSLVDTTFHTNFLIRGRNIYIGTEGTSVDHVFKYGVGNGLVSLERTIDDSQKVVTRLRAYGNTTNMPSDYYFYASMKAIVNVPAGTGMSQAKRAVIDQKGVVGVTSIIFEEKAFWNNDNFFNNVGDSSYIVPTNTPAYAVDTEHSHPFVTLYYQPDENSDEYKTVIAYLYRRPDYKDWLYMEVIEPIESNFEFYNWFAKYCDDNDRFYTKRDLTFKINGDNFKFTDFRYHNPDLMDYGYYPNNLAVTRLMLPGFPTQDGFEKDLGYIDEKYKGYKLICTKSDIYIESPRISNLGAVEGSVYIDGTDNEYTRKDIYPSLEGLTATDLINAGYAIDVDSNQNENLDEISVGGCTSVDKDNPALDNGNGDYNQSLGSACYVYLKDIGFDINNCLLKGETAKIHMKSGMCVGREFEITQVANETNKKKGRYKLTIKREEDSTLGIRYPNSDYNIEAGDKFVLLGIKPPSLYYDVAKQRLLKEALEYFINNDFTRFAFTPTIDNLWMARERRKKKAECKEEESIYNTIQAGDLMMIESDDLGIGTSVRISSLTIKENSQSAIPEFDVQLQDKKSVGAIQRIQNKLEDYTNSGGGGLSYDQVKTVISDSGSYRFISKRDDDFAEGQITLEKGLIAQSSHDGKETAADGLIEYYTEEES